MSKILYNQTVSDIFIADTGILVPASPASYTIPPQNYLLWAASSDIIVYVGSGDIIVNDGSSNLSPSDGVDLIKGIFPNPVGLLGGTDGTQIGNVGDALKVTGSFSGGGTQYAEDSVHVSGDQLTMAGVVQKSADAALSGDGDRAVLQIDGTGFLKVNVKNSALPSGAATAANQATEITSLSSIDTKLTTTNASLSTIDAGIPAALGQTTMSASMPVVIASNQTDVPVSINAASLAALESITVQNPAGASAVNIQDGGNSITVDAVSLPLPTGAATAALQTQPGVDIGDVTINNAAGASAVNIQDGGNSITIDGTVTATPSADATFCVYAPSVAIANNKSMLSLVNTSGSTVKLKILSIKIKNVQTTAVTGIVAQFNLFRFVSHSAGTSLTPLPHDTSDTLSVSITARTGATITSEASSYIMRWLWSSDDWGPGGADVESFDHSIQEILYAYNNVSGSKPITLNANEGIHIKQTTNSTAGIFDLEIVFTQV